MLAVAFESDSHLFGGAKRLEDLHGLGRISQRLAINILDQVTRAQTECSEVLPGSSRLHPVSGLLAIDGIRRWPNDVRLACQVLGHMVLNAFGILVISCLTRVVRASPLC